MTKNPHEILLLDFPFDIILHMTRERVYYIFDTVQQRNFYKRLDLNDAQREARRLNTSLVKDGELQEGESRYTVKGGWAIHKLP